ncbi:MAG: hypothetical protein JNL96_17605 [Planctomycetaceae bacterium]|nr:hypothetical protein [Planctomycetaceae bacterium]MBN8626139.1 hypothetical protein [Planctomycetota bacterium]
MMDFNYANLTVAIIVPFLSVYAAQHLASHNEKKQDAKEAFIAINRHLQEFTYAFMALRRQSVAALAGEEGRRRQDEIAQTLISCVVNLENDCMVLGMIFDRKADFVGKQIRDFSSRSKLLLEEESPPPPPPDDCYKLLQKDMGSVISGVKVLWNNQVNVTFFGRASQLWHR